MDNIIKCSNTQESQASLSSTFWFIVCPFHFSAAVEQVFKIGSMEPGAMLFDASKEFEASDFQLQVTDQFLEKQFLFVDAFLTW